MQLTLCKSENCWCLISTSLDGNFLLHSRQASWAQSVWAGFVSAPGGRRDLAGGSNTSTV